MALFAQSPEVLHMLMLLQAHIDKQKCSHTYPQSEILWQSCLPTRGFMKSKLKEMLWAMLKTFRGL